MLATLDCAGGVAEPCKPDHKLDQNPEVAEAAFLSSQCFSCLSRKVTNLMRNWRRGGGSCDPEVEPKGKGKNVDIKAMMEVQELLKSMKMARLHVSSLRES